MFCSPKLCVKKFILHLFLIFWLQHDSWITSLSSIFFCSCHRNNWRSFKTNPSSKTKVSDVLGNYRLRGGGECRWAYLIPRRVLFSTIMDLPTTHLSSEQERLKVRTVCVFVPYLIWVYTRKTRNQYTVTSLIVCLSQI